MVEYKFELHVISGSYVGLNACTLFNIFTLNASIFMEYKIHTGDAKLGNEPILFKDMMKSIVEEDSYSDDDSDLDYEKFENIMRKITMERVVSRRQPQPMILHRLGPTRNVAARRGYYPGGL